MCNINEYYECYTGDSPPRVQTSERNGLFKDKSKWDSNAEIETTISAINLAVGVCSVTSNSHQKLRIVMFTLCNNGIFSLYNVKNTI